MIKLEALENFSLERFKEVKNIKRASKDTFGMIIKGDVFECEKGLADYLLGANPLNRPVVKVIEVEPEIINKDNVSEKLDEALEKLKNEELVETIPVVNKNGVIVDTVVKDKQTKKKKHSKK